MRATALCGTGLAIIAVVLGTPTKANAQLTLLNATGYGGIGFTAGVLAGAAVGGTECDGFLCISPAMALGGLAGVVAGIVAGRKMALRAERNVRDGEALTGRRGLHAPSVRGLPFPERVPILSYSLTCHRVLVRHVRRGESCVTKDSH